MAKDDTKAAVEAAPPANTMTAAMLTERNTLAAQLSEAQRIVRELEPRKRAIEEALRTYGVSFE